MVNQLYEVFFDTVAYCEMDDGYERTMNKWCSVFLDSQFRHDPEPDFFFQSFSSLVELWVERIVY